MGASAEQCSVARPFTPARAPLRGSAHDQALPSNSAARSIYLRFVLRHVMCLVHIFMQIERQHNKQRGGNRKRQDNAVYYAAVQDA